MAEASNPAPDMADRGHIPALDGLRGIAVALVLCFHCYRTGPLTDVFGIGWVGVDLFFVLSGFLITGILLRTRGTAGYYKRFIVRRALRVFPLYYMALAAVFLVERIHSFPVVQGLGALAPWFWTYTANLLFASHGWPSPGLSLNHFWSLAIEEQFYLFWPWVVAFADRRTLLGTMLAGMLISLAIRLALPIQPFAYTFTLARLDGLLLGALLALGLRARADLVQLLRTPVLLAGIIVLGLALVLGGLPWDPRPVMLRWGILGADLLFAGVLAFAVTLAPARPLPRLLSLRPLRLLGRYSYGLYVIHWPLYQLMLPPLLVRLPRWGCPAPWITPVALTLYTITLACMAVVSFELIERRILALKDRLAPDPAA